ncbi:MAG: response regulator transcription factor [Halocynthiibacter sp.]
MAIPRLLIVDDDSEIRQMMTRFFQKNGFSVVAAATGAGVQDALTRGRVDLILLDVMLGDESGVTICEKLRRVHQVPVIMVSALSADHQRMAGYEVGADDYIAKPFNPELLLARVRAVLRRGRRTASLVYRRNTRAYRFQGWSYDGRRDEVRAPGGFQVALSRRETSLLKVLLANPHIPLTREEIAAALDIARDADRAHDAADGRAIDVLVGRLRSKIEPNPKAPQIIRTERGVGYVLACEVQVLENL